MKKILTFIYLLILSAEIFGQSAKLQSEPQKFTALDNVKLIFDVSGTPLESIAGVEDIYLWAWADGVGDFKTNGKWENSKEAAKLIPMPGEKMKFYFKFPVKDVDVTYNNVSEMLGAVPGTLKKFGTLLKTKTGSKQSKDVVIDLDPLQFIDAVTRSFPAAVTQEDVITLYLNQNLAEQKDLKYASGDFKAILKAFDSEGKQIDVDKTISAKSEGKGIHSVSFIPKDFVFQVVDKPVLKLKYTFVSSADASIKSPEFEITLIQ